MESGVKSGFRGLGPVGDVDLQVRMDGKCGIAKKWSSPSTSREINFLNGYEWI